MRKENNLNLKINSILFNQFKRQLGKKAYELKDHLGNVRITHSDIKMPKTPPNGTFEVDLLSKKNIIALFD